MRQTISACLVVYNEEKIIQHCLENLKDVVDEIVVVHDGPCTDKTLDICRQYTNKIFIRHRIGCSEPHRPFSFEISTGDWVLWIDADEVLSQELRKNIKDLVEDSDVDLYYFIWPYTNGVRPLSISIEHPYRACLARRCKLYHYGLPHEPLRTYGNIKKVPFIMEHRPTYNNFTWNKFRTKWLPWTYIHAKWIWKDPNEIPCYGVKDKNSLLLHLERFRHRPLLKIPEKFIYHLAYQIYKGMWKIGIVGLKITLLGAINKATFLYYVYKYRPKKKK